MVATRRSAALAAANAAQNPATGDDQEIAESNVTVDDQTATGAEGETMDETVKIDENKEGEGQVDVTMNDVQETENAASESVTQDENASQEVDESQEPLEVVEASQATVDGEDQIGEGSTEQAPSIEEGTDDVEQPKKKGKVGRPKKEKPDADAKKGSKKGGPSIDFMSAIGGRGKGKKLKPEPGKPLIVDGMPVNPLSEPAVKNAYGYDPAMDLVPLGQGQLKSAYRRSKAQLDTPQIDAKRYKLEVKDHLLDDEEGERRQHEEQLAVEEQLHMLQQQQQQQQYHESATDHNNMDTTVHSHDHYHHPTTPSSSSAHSYRNHFSHTPTVVHTPAPPPLIPHAPSPLASRRVSNADGWSSSVPKDVRRRRSDASTTVKEWPTIKPPSMSPHMPPQHTNSSSPASSSSAVAPSTPVTPPTPRQTRLSQAEQFPMAAPKVIEAPKLATPVDRSDSSSTRSSASSSGATTYGAAPLSTSRRNSTSGGELSHDAFLKAMDHLTTELESANATMAGSATLHHHHHHHATHTNGN